MSERELMNRVALMNPVILQSGSVLVCKTLLVDMQIFEFDASLTSLVY
jgi:hypothetical protein